MDSAVEPVAGGVRSTDIGSLPDVSASFAAQYQAGAAPVASPPQSPYDAVRSSAASVIGSSGSFPILACGWDRTVVKSIAKAARAEIGYRVPINLLINYFTIEIVRGDVE